LVTRKPDDPLVFEEADATVDGGGGSHEMAKKRPKKNQRRFEHWTQRGVAAKKGRSRLRHAVYKIRMRE